MITALIRLPVTSYINRLSLSPTATLSEVMSLLRYQHPVAKSPSKVQGRNLQGSTIYINLCFEVHMSESSLADGFRDMHVDVLALHVDLSCTQRHAMCLIAVISFVIRLLICVTVLVL